MTPRTLFALSLLAAAAPAQFRVYEPAELAALGGAAGRLAVGDLDGDGIDDLVIASPQPGAPLRVALADAAGGFSAPTFLGADQAGPFALVDTDDDDVLDLVHGTALPQTVAVSKGLGDGTFAAPVPIVPAGSISTTTVSVLSTGDVNGDGFTDFAIEQGYFLFSDRRVFVGNGDGTFSEAADLASGFFASVALGDVDGDGLDDVVVGGSAPTWRRSLGDGTFDAPQPAVQGAVVDALPSASVEFIRVEGVDVVMHALVGGTFEEVARVTLPFGVATASTSVEDVDGDGLRDVLVTGSDLAHVFLQTPGAAFELAASYTPSGDIAAQTVVAEDAAGRRNLASAGLFTGVSIAVDATYAPDAPFTDLGGNTPGSVGFPTQVLETDGADLSVRVLAAAPSAPIFAIWGGSLGAPLGTSATSPSPDRVLGPFTTSPLGTLEVSANDALPLGLDVHTQWWIVDEDGLASTSTVRIGD